MTQAIARRNDLTEDCGCRRPPLFLKIAPDLGDAELKDIAEVSLSLPPFLPPLLSLVHSLSGRDRGKGGRDHYKQYH